MEANLPLSLPCLSNTLKDMSRVNKPVLAGQFRWDELAEYLHEMECIPYVWLGEDATAVIDTVEHDPKTGLFVGFVATLDNHGLPNTTEFKVQNFRLPNSGHW